MTSPAHPITWLAHAGQRLGLVPSLGGGVAAWQTEGAEGAEGAEGPVDLWRPWDGRSEDRYHLASFAMLPWSNRISGGGFTQDGQAHAVRPNRAGEPYPIHGDAWLQPWQLSQPAADTLLMSLRCDGFDGGPYAYEAAQSFRLWPGGMDQQVWVRHRGARPMPYGLGVHPWFPRTPATRIQAKVQGVWLSGPDPLPVAHTQAYPEGWDLNHGVPAHGSLIDNAYTGWAGQARIDWPERGLRLTLNMPDFERDGGAANHFCLIYRPPEGPAFCFEPITHPIDAFHLPGRPGLRVLQPGQEMRLSMRWCVGPASEPEALVAEAFRHLSPPF